MVHSIIKKIRSSLKKLSTKKEKPREAEKKTPDGATDSRKKNGDFHGKPRQENGEQPKKRRRRRRKPKTGGMGDQGAKEYKPSRRKKEPWDIKKFVVLPEEGKTRFHDLGLPDGVMQAIQDLEYQYCTPIQAQILPSTLNGKDATGKAQTGTGKTAAFLITVFTRLFNRSDNREGSSGSPKALVIAPTRELVIQIADEARAISKYCSMNVVTVFGGMDYQKQRRQLESKQVDMVVATPGRLLDFARQGDLNLRKVQILILDEADRMLDMGFIPDVRKIIHKTPHKKDRQTLLFSATLTPQITRLAAQWTTDPVIVEIEPEQVEVDSVEQIVYLVTKDEKLPLLYNIIEKQALSRVIVFCNRRYETRKLFEILSGYGIKCSMISGEIPQKKRIKTLEAFKAGSIRVLVATDVAGRGLHVEGISHVINYTLPHDPEDYVHRIGRTGRAGASGTSVSFACEEDSFQLPAIEEYLKHPLPCVYPEDDWLILPPKPKKKYTKPKNRQPKNRQRRYHKPKGNRPQNRRRPTGNKPGSPKEG